jgi:hypothetical protein
VWDLLKRRNDILGAINRAIDIDESKSSLILWSLTNQ